MGQHLFQLFIASVDVIYSAQNGHAFCSQRSGRKAADGEDLQEKLGEELADMIHYTVAIAAVNNIDLSQVILEKDKKASVKYGRAVNLEAFLAEREA